MAIKSGDKVYVAPSGVQKEELIIDDIFTLNASNMELIDAPKTPNLKQSACTPLWFEVFKLRPDARAVIHTHSMNAQLCTLLNGDEDKEFRMTHFEMLKGIQGHGYEDNLVVPIIDNRPTEDLLAQQLGEAIKKYPKTNAVLVRRHGLYVWGDSWANAKIHAECYDYLFESAVKVRQMQIDHTAKPLSGTYNVSVSSAKTTDGSQTTVKVCLFDIEGTTTPITFVKDVLFPYATNHVQSHLTSTWESPVTQADVAALLEQSMLDQKSGDNDPIMIGTQAVTSLTEGVEKFELIEALTTYVVKCIALDRKIGALKQLQGHIWRAGYESGDLKAQIYEDVPNLFAEMKKLDIRCAIYSSGSREAQHLLFKYSDRGDLRKYITSYYDTSSGGKREQKSYENVGLALGVDTLSEVLFVTDVHAEAVAAAAAGMQVVISIRPGNAPLPADNQFRIISSFDELMATLGAAPNSLTSVDHDERARKKLKVASPHIIPSSVVHWS